jgi:dihydrofolate reductase
MGSTRKLVANLFISLYGVVEEPGNWHFPYFNDEMGAAVDTVLSSADTMLLGRKTYDDHAGAWPEREAAGGEDAEFAKLLGDARKIVVSRQQLELTWRNSEQLEGDLVEAVTALKSEPGDANIAISGSISVVRQLLAAGLLDELRLLVHPIAVRKGMRLFDEGEPPIPLKLLSSEAFSTGVLSLVYGPADSAGDATYEDAKAYLSQSER